MLSRHWNISVWFSRVKLQKESGEENWSVFCFCSLTRSLVSLLSGVYFHSIREDTLGERTHSGRSYYEGTTGKIYLGYFSCQRDSMSQINLMTNKGHKRLLYGGHLFISHFLKGEKKIKILVVLT